MVRYSACMPTTAERQALVFVAALAIVGAGVRVADARRFAREMNGVVAVVGTDTGSPGSRALAAQIAAVDSARAASPGRSRKLGISRRSNSSKQSGRPTSEKNSWQSHQPDNWSERQSHRSTVRERLPPVSTDNPIDINNANASEIERLPRVGSALAKRIIAWRNSHGPFSTEEDLRHVPGIGVTTAALLVPLVTFSSGYRPFQGEARPSRRYPDFPAI